MRLCWAGECPHAMCQECWPGVEEADTVTGPIVVGEGICPHHPPSPPAGQGSVGSGEQGEPLPPCCACGDTPARNNARRCRDTSNRGIRCRHFLCIRNRDGDPSCCSPACHGILPAALRPEAQEAASEGWRTPEVAVPGLEAHAVGMEEALEDVMPEEGEAHW